MFYSQIAQYNTMKNNTYDLSNYLLLIQAIRSSKMSHYNQGNVYKIFQIKKA